MTEAYSQSLQPLAVPSPVETLIHVIRGQNVMLDRDLARLYGVRPIALRQQVKRNQDRFPADFMFQLTGQEAEELVSQSVIPSRRSLGGFLPYVFTQEGIAMLSSVLRSQRAVQMNISIMRAFVRLRELMVAHKDIAARVERLERGQERTASVIEILVEDIDRLTLRLDEAVQEPAPSTQRIGYLPSKEG